MASITNREIADKLEKMAEILDLQLENGFQVAAYRKAADAIEALSEPADAIWRKHGMDGLMEIEHVGRDIPRPSPKSSRVSAGPSSTG